MISTPDSIKRYTIYINTNTFDILKRIAKHNTRRWSALNKVPHGGHERQSSAKGSCEHQKWNTLQDGGYIPTRLWPLERRHLLQQKLSAHQMQNNQKNSPPGSETSYPSQIKTTTRLTSYSGNRKQGLFTASPKGTNLSLGQTPPTWDHQSSILIWTDLVLCQRFIPSTKPTTATTQSEFLTHSKELVVTVKAPHDSWEIWKTGSGSFVLNSSSLRNQWIANFKTVHLNIKKHFFLQIGSTLRELRETEQ